MLKLLKRLFVFVFVLLLVVIVGGIVFLKTFDLNKYKPYITEQAYKYLGRKIEIVGDSSLGISLNPTLILRDVQVENASWATEPLMLKVGTLEVKLSLMPLLKKEIVVDKIALLDTQINLSKNASGEANWVFKLPENTAEPKKVESANLTSQNKDKVEEINTGSFALAGFVARNVVIENAQIAYDDYASSQKTNLMVNRVEMSAQGLDAPLNLAFDVVFNNQNINGKAVLGSVSSVLEGGKIFPVDLDVNAYGVQLKAVGELSNLMADLGYSLTLDLTNPQGNFGAPALQFGGQVKGNLKNISVDVSALDVAGNVVRGKVKADISASRPVLWADLSSDLFDLRRLSQKQKVAFVFPEIIASAQASDLVPDENIPFDLLNMLDADVTLKIAQLIVDEGMQAQNVNVRAHLKNGILNVTPLMLNFGGGALDAVLSVKAPAQSLSLNLKSKDMLLQKMHKEFDVTSESDFGIVSGGNLDLDIQLSGHGKTYRQLVNNLDGRAIAIVGKSVVKPGKLEILDGNFVMQLLNTLNLTKKADKVKNLNMTCAVVRSDLKNGKAVFPKGIAFNSEQLNLVSDGKINLINDEIDFSVHPFSGKVIDANLAQAISSFIKIKGTLQEPKIRLDDAQAVQTIVGIAASGGTTYLGSKLVLDADSSPCYTALAGTPYQSRFPAPSKASQEAQKAYQNTQKVINDSIRDIKSSAEDILGILKGKKK